jgi:hypothetical protein
VLLAGGIDPSGVIVELNRDSREGRVAAGCARPSRQPAIRGRLFTQLVGRIFARDWLLHPAHSFSGVTVWMSSTPVSRNIGRFLDKIHRLIADKT